jgi:hypothetical protein
MSRVFIVPLLFLFLYSCSFYLLLLPFPSFDMSISISISKLNEHNYRTWVAETKDLLKHLNVWRVADGSEIRPRPPAAPVALVSTVEINRVRTVLSTVPSVRHH